MLSLSFRPNKAWSGCFCLTGAWFSNLFVHGVMLTLLAGKLCNISHSIHGTGTSIYIYYKNQPNVGKYSIHGSYGIWCENLDIIQKGGTIGGGWRCACCWITESESIFSKRGIHVVGEVSEDLIIAGGGGVNYLKKDLVNGIYLFIKKLGRDFLNNFYQRNLKIVHVYTLQETNISPKHGILKMIFLFPRWDMLIPWRVAIFIDYNFNFHPCLVTGLCRCT